MELALATTLAALAAGPACMLDWSDPAVDSGVEADGEDASGDADVPPDTGADADGDDAAEDTTAADGDDAADDARPPDGDADADAEVDAGPGCGDGTCVPAERNCVCPADCPGTVETCNGADDNCDGATDEDWDLDTDPNNCGTCGRVCSLPNVDPQACRDGDCVVGACVSGFSDCTADPGCETPWNNAHCGSCTEVCGGDRSICCYPETGRCTDTYNPADCGGCGNACAGLCCRGSCCESGVPCCHDSCCPAPSACCGTTCCPAGCCSHDANLCADDGACS
jgi:hypothetical protein